MPDSPNKIAIIGAGSVGATIAYACMIRGVGKQIAIYDIAKSKVDAEVLDLNHGLQFVPMTTVIGSDDLQICEGADVIVITAGAKQKPGQTRMDLVHANAEICRKLIPQLMKIAPNALYLLVTNPVDVITYITLKLTGLPTNRVLGSGTVLDSSRFRYLIAQHCNVAVQNVHAYIVGEHGDSEIPLWSSATIGNVPVNEWKVPGHRSINDADKESILKNVRTAAYQIIQGKGATNYAIGLATAKILEALLHNENRVLPVSSLLTNYAGLNDVCLSVPSIVNRSGVEQPLPISMTDAEREGLHKSANAIQQAIRAVGF